MGHSIDISKYEVHTDLALDIVENNNIDGVKTVIHKNGNVKITDVFIDSNGSKIIGKKKGQYVTIEFEDITDTDNFNNVRKVFAKELTKILHINKNDFGLIIGLGNSKSTPDSLGPLTIDKVLVTNHLFLLGDMDSKYRRVSTFSPGVMGNNGIETSDIIKSIIKTISPDFVIVVDALASQSLARVNKTIQMTDAGIAPGSGIGNTRKEISQEVLNIPVIAVGVPTVLDAATIVSDTISYMYKHYTYNINNKNNPDNKMMIGSPNYLQKNIKECIDDRKKIFGIIGNLDDAEFKQLINEVLTPIGYNLMVTTKEIDFLIDKLSNLIAQGINMTLHEMSCN